MNAALSKSLKRQAENQRIMEMNDRIKKLFRKGCGINGIAKSQGVSVSYVTQMAKKWEAK